MGFTVFFPFFAKNFLVMHFFSAPELKRETIATWLLIAKLLSVSIGLKHPEIIGMFMRVTINNECSIIA